MSDRATEALQAVGDEEFRLMETNANQPRAFVWTCMLPRNVTRVFITKCCPGGETGGARSRAHWSDRAGHFRA
jgi:hypothetical protein